MPTGVRRRALRRRVATVYPEVVVPTTGGGGATRATMESSGDAPEDDVAIHADEEDRPAPSRPPARRNVVKVSYRFQDLDTDTDISIGPCRVIRTSAPDGDGDGGGRVANAAGVILGAVWRGIRSTLPCGGAGGGSGSGSGSGSGGGGRCGRRLGDSGNDADDRRTGGSGRSCTGSAVATVASAAALAAM